MNDLVLEAPAAVASVPVAKASTLVRLDPQVKEQLDIKAEKFVNEISALDANGPEFSAKAAQINNLGQSEVNRSPRKAAASLTGQPEPWRTTEASAIP